MEEEEEMFSLFALSTEFLARRLAHTHTILPEKRKRSTINAFDKIKL